MWKNADGLEDKHGVVFGTGPSAFDVAEDMVNVGCASVTVIQRGQCRKSDARMTDDPKWTNCCQQLCLSNGFQRSATPSSTTKWTSGWLIVSCLVPHRLSVCLYSEKRSKL